MKVQISADAVGVTGITDTNELLFGRPHYEFMRAMTNIQIERLDPRADLIAGYHKHLSLWTENRGVA